MAAKEDTGKAEVPISVGNAGQQLLLVGDIEPQARVFIFPKIPGKIEQLSVEVSSAVRKGDVLAVVEHEEGAREEDIEAAKAQVRQAEAALEMAKRLEDTKSWEGDIALAEAQVQQAEAAFKVASSAAEAGLNLAEKKLSDATITAPISGIVSMRNMDLGGMAAPQSPIFEIVDMDVVKAEVSIVESDLHKIKVGYEALVSVDALQEPVSGKVTLISPTLDKMTRTTTVEISMENRDHKLRPGMFARAKVSVGF